VSCLARYIGIDYSGAATPTASLKFTGGSSGCLGRQAAPSILTPPIGPRRPQARTQQALW
jgi:hypothetical protein